MKKINNCPRCKTRMALFSAYISEWNADLEPYEDGKREEIENITCDVSFSAIICPECKTIKWLSVEQSDNKICKIVNHTNK